jgi:acyl-CoA hydrolase
LGHPQLSVVSGSGARVSTSREQGNAIMGARITDNVLAMRNAQRIVAVVYSIWSGPSQMHRIDAARVLKK